jgi:hypothetical protein
VWNEKRRVGVQGASSGLLPPVWPSVKGLLSVAAVHPLGQARGESSKTGAPGLQ